MMKNRLKIKRVYERPETDDGLRILVDRLWPRGLTKEKAKIDKWIKDIAPSDGLRRWFAHKKERWDEFKKRYTEELKGNKLVRELKILSKKENITLVYAAKDKTMNNARVLWEFLKKQ